MPIRRAVVFDFFGAEQSGVTAVHAARDCVGTSGSKLGVTIELATGDAPAMQEIARSKSVEGMSRMP